ncbi:MAG: class I SAM-dependent methyltransferase [Streptosporangiaceae bacterium]
MTGTANASQFADWNGDSGRRWAENSDRRDAVLAPVADALLTAASISPGNAVIDIGCGCGATTLAAAQAAGPAGTVLGIDLSGPMLSVARRRAREQATANVRFEQADAQTHALPAAAFDAAISRFGTMFFTDPEAALANVAGALRPGARLCLATWQPLAANDWLTVPGAVLLRYAAPPETTDGPGMFAQSDPVALTATLTNAGFDAVRATPVTVTMTLGADAAEAAQYLAASGPGRAVLDTIAANVRPAALDELRTALAEHAGPGGVRLDAAVWVTTATRRA